MGFLLNQLAAIVRQRTAHALAPLSITPRSLGVLLVIARQPGVGQTELGRRLRMDRTTVSQTVDELTRAGLIDRGSAVDDRRQHQLVLTPDGWISVERATSLVAQVERGLRARWTEASRRVLKDELAQLLAEVGA